MQLRHCVQGVTAITNYNNRTGSNGSKKAVEAPVASTNTKAKSTKEVAIQPGTGGVPAASSPKDKRRRSSMGDVDKLIKLKNSPPPLLEHHTGILPQLNRLHRRLSEPGDVSPATIR